MKTKSDNAYTSQITCKRGEHPSSVLSSPCSCSSSSLPSIYGWTASGTFQIEAKAPFHSAFYCPAAAVEWARIKKTNLLT